MSDSPSKISRLEQEALMDDLGEPMENPIAPSSELRRRSSAASSSAGSIGVRTIIHEEAQSLITANVLSPFLKELQDQMQILRIQQDETANAGRIVVSEIQKAMEQQQKMHKQLENQMHATALRQKEHENVLNELTGEAQGSVARMQQLRDQNAYTQMAVQQIHQQQVKLEGDNSGNKGRVPHDVEMNSTPSSTDFGRDDRGLGRPVMGQYPPPVVRNVSTEQLNPRSEYGVHGQVPPFYDGDVTTSSNRFLPNAKIAQIPVFDVGRFTSWRREMCFWKELHDYLPEKQIISFVGLNGGAVIRSKVMKLFRDTVHEPEERTFTNLLELLDKDFSMSVREKDMHQMDRLFEYRREEGESIQGFWAKFDLLLSHLEGSSSHLSDELLFTRSLRAMNLSYGQRTSLLALLDCRAFPHTVANLRLCSIQLLGLYKGFDKKEKEVKRRCQFQRRKQTGITND